MGARVVLGLGGTVDYELTWDSTAVGDAARAQAIRITELAGDIVVSDERSLLIVLLHHMQRGTGGEPRVIAEGVVEQFAARFRFATTLGGTGVRAGYVLDSLGVAATQHLVSVDDHVRALLPSSTRYVTAAHEDSLHPHVIVQYPEGASIVLEDGVVKAESSNRVIFANDVPNREVQIAPSLSSELAAAQIFLVSGFNTVQSVEVLDRRLGELKQAMGSLPPDALVYYEDAAFHVPELAARVLSALASRVDVHGVNEDEMFGYLGREFDLLDGNAVCEALTELAEIIAVPVLVVHTRHWAIATGPRASEFRAALDMAVTVAATRYRVGDRASLDEIEQTRRLPRRPASIATITAIEARSESPVVGVAAYDLDVPAPTTIGLGDSFVGGFLGEVALRGDGNAR